MESDYILTVGLEIHAELKTRTKMFCDSKNDPEEKRPNVHVCPVCMGHPGTLPVINKEAVRHVLRVGLALGGTLAEKTYFDRKNYFYPDIPKGYQISQYKDPLVSGGSLADIAITRVHLEEDTAKSSHEKGNYSLVDFNRAGVPLMELVTEPVINSPQQASAFARELQLLLQYLKAGDANMEKGEMRIEANISVSKDPTIFGTKVEVKNLNSFKAVEKAIAFEKERHIALLERGGKVVQETRGWDEHSETTFSQRIKEESHDYRYFPDPDLPTLFLSTVPEFSKNELLKTIPELPWVKRDRYVKKYEMKISDTDVFIASPRLASYFEGVASLLGDDRALTKLLANYITSDLLGLMKGGGIAVENFSMVEEKISQEHFAKLIRMIGDQKISSRGAKDILKIMFEKGGDPETVATGEGLLQQSNEEDLKEIVKKIINEHAVVVEDYKKGKSSALQFFVGQGMKATKGSANPAILQKILIELLS